MDQTELLYKIELLQEMGKAMADNVPGMFAGAVKPVNELMEGVLDVMMEMVEAIADLQETKH